MYNKDKLIEYIRVESRILRKSDPRTKGFRENDWDGYNAALDKLLIVARPIHVGEMEDISKEFNVPFFKEQAISVVTKWNEMIKIQNDLLENE